MTMTSDESQLEVTGDPRLIRVQDYVGELRLLAVRYDGTCFAGEPIEASELTKYRTVYVVRRNDLVISNINAVNGAIAVVPQEFDGCVVSHEYTVLRAKDGVDPRVLQMTLRSPECRSDLLVLASGIGRHRVTYAAASRTRVPLARSTTTKAVIRDLDEAETLLQKARILRERARNRLETDLAIDTPTARELLKAFKPPK